MRQIPTWMLIPWLAVVATAGCSGAQPPQPASSESASPEATTKAAAPDDAGDDGTCPPKDATTNPPTCPEGCTWDGQHCQKQRGVIVDE